MKLPVSASYFYMVNPEKWYYNVSDYVLRTGHPPMDNGPCRDVAPYT